MLTHIAAIAHMLTHMIAHIAFMAHTLTHMIANTARNSIYLHSIAKMSKCQREEEKADVRPTFHKLHSVCWLAKAISDQEIDRKCGKRPNMLSD